MATLEDAQLLAQKVLATEEVLPLAVEPFFGIFQSHFERLLAMALVRCEARRRRLQVDDVAAVDDAPLRVLKTDGGELLL